MAELGRMRLNALQGIVNRQDPNLDDKFIKLFAEPVEGSVIGPGNSYRTKILKIAKKLRDLADELPANTKTESSESQKEQAKTLSLFLDSAAQEFLELLILKNDQNAWIQDEHAVDDNSRTVAKEWLNHANIGAKILKDAECMKTPALRWFGLEHLGSNLKATKKLMESISPEIHESLERKQSSHDDGYIHRYVKNDLENLIIAHEQIMAQKRAKAL